MELAEDLTILITGATDGLGERVATDLARGGMTLLLHGRDPEKGERVLAKIRGAPVEEGARHVERLAVSEELAGVSGTYFDQDKPSRAQEQAYDEKARRRLRELSFGWTGLDRE